MDFEIRPTRRQVLGAAALLAASPVLGAPEPPPRTRPDEPIIDIHQHTNYSGRSDEQLLRHQKAMGVSYTLLLPAGTPVIRPSTLNGKANGLQASCGGFDTCIAIAKAHPEAYGFYANEVPDLSGAAKTIAGQLKQSAVGIGEQKFHVDCDSPYIDRVAEVAKEFNVPVLMHFQQNTYNLNILDFHKTLEKFPTVNFIGHAQTFWGYIDKGYKNTLDLYPKGGVTPGGLTDRLLSDYPNMWADISAGSGLNALTRDHKHAREFLDRHQDKVMYGSDCNDRVGHGPVCQGWLTIRAIRELSNSKTIERKILYENAKRLFKLKAI